MTMAGPAALLAVALAAFAPGAAWAQSAKAPQDPGRATPGTTFKCQDGGELTADFVSRGAQFVAIVDAGDGPHALPYRAWTDGPVRLTWSDGRRTLTWSPGVQIMWMDGAMRRMCGRGEHRH